MRITGSVVNWRSNLYLVLGMDLEDDRDVFWLCSCEVDCEPTRPFSIHKKEFLNNFRTVADSFTAFIDAKIARAAGLRWLGCVCQNKKGPLWIVTAVKDGVCSGYTLDGTPWASHASDLSILADSLVQYTQMTLQTAREEQ